MPPDIDASPVATSSLSEGSVLAGKYRIDGVIGEGGMGVVLRATHLELDAVVAIKVVKHELIADESVTARFIAEARAAAKIKSEHVARVLDVGRLDDGVPFIVMEHLNGHDVYHALLAPGTPLPVARVVDYVLQACEALAEAHAAGIVHRDLKPENLFLHRRPDGSEIIKVLDFGISKNTAAAAAGELQLTNPTAVIGSPYYMSPEQMRASISVDARADVYAVGAILFELCVGRPLFFAENISEVCRMVLSDAPARASTLRPDLPRGLDDVLFRCLEKDRERRYANVAELAEALTPFGTPAARASAARIARVLGVRPPRSVVPAEIDGTTLVASPLAEARTVPQATQSPARPRRWLPWAGGVLVAAGLGFVVALAVRVHPAPAPVASSARPDPSAEPAAPVRPAAPALSVLPVPGAVSASAQASAVAKPPPSARAEPKARPARRAVRHTLARSKPAAPTIPDFGGRR